MKNKDDFSHRSPPFSFGEEAAVAHRPNLGSSSYARGGGGLIGMAVRCGGECTLLRSHSTHTPEIYALDRGSLSFFAMLVLERNPCVLYALGEGLGTFRAYLIVSTKK
jgi:hypothetical protein